jgi:excisionase family DNA binding protein
MTARALALAAQPNEPAAPEPLLTADEVAPLLRLTTDGVYRLARTGELPAVRYARRVLFTASQVQTFIATHTDGTR